MKSLDTTVQSSVKLRSAIDGLKAGIPIAVGYIPMAITFGLLARSAGVPDYITILMSLVIFAGASQFVGINLIALGTGPWEIILTTFVLNLRHLLMSAYISQKVEPGTSKKFLSLISFGITDETFTVTSLRQEPKLKPAFILGLNFMAFSAWNIGTWIGVFLSAGLPSAIKTSMNIALYAMFIGLLIPSCKKSKPVLFIAVLAMAVHSLLYYADIFSGISIGSRIVITTVISSLAGAIMFAEEENA